MSRDLCQDFALKPTQEAARAELERDRAAAANMQVRQSALAPFTLIRFELLLKRIERRPCSHLGQREVDH